MRASLLLALALITVPLAGCAAPEGPTPPEGAIPFETVAKGDNSGIDEQGTVVVRSAEVWQALWENHTAVEGSQAPDRPEIDFEQRMVLAAFKGQSPNGCHGTEITNVTGQPDGTILVEGEHYVVEGIVCSEQITYPFHVVELDRYGGEVDFQMSETTRQAGNGSQDPGTPGQDDPGPGDQGSYTCRKRSDATDAAGNGSTVAFDTIDQGGQSGIEEVCLTTARNQTAWRDLWTAHQSRTTEPDPRPEVDFSQRMVVAIFKGESPNTCHGAEIENLTANGDTLTVEGAFVKLEGGFCGQAITYPFHIVETDRYETVRFDVENETRQM